MEEEILEVSEELLQVADSVAEVVETTVEAAPPASEIASAVVEAGETIVEETSSFIKWITGYFTWSNLFKFIGALLVFFVLWIVYKLILKAFKRIPEEKVSLHKRMLLARFLKYLFYIASVMYVCHLLGINLSAIWGAAGIAGVAIGFAAQTSVSNLISGLFVLTEGTLKVGDLVVVGDITGTVASITLLSVRVNTLDNQMVRIPNSTIINNNLTNINFNEKRRMTLSVSIAYESDMTKALEALNKVGDYCPTVLKDPALSVWYNGFADSGIEMVVAAWFEPANFLQTKNDLFIAIKRVLDEAGIEIPFNQLDLKVKNEEIKIIK